MASQDYTTRSALFNDLNLWLAWKRNEALTLGHLPKLASERWTWIVQNWSTLYLSFKAYANGDDYLENNLETLSANVFGWISGARVNPLGDVTFFQNIMEFLLLIPVSSVGLTVSEQTFINLEAKRVSDFTIDTFKGMLNYLVSQRDLAFELIGLGDPVYAEFKDRTMVAKTREGSVGDLDALSDAVFFENFILGIIFDFKYDAVQSPNLLAISQSNVDADTTVGFNTGYQTFIQVPFSGSLEQMAEDYMGSKEAWYELVTVNNLKPPYVDAQGVKLTLVENGAGVSVRVTNEYADRVRIGAIVGVSSRVVPLEYRTVERATDNGDGTITLQLRGADDCSKFKTIHFAYLRAYAPETIQEFSFVKIPFNIASTIPKTPNPTSQALKSLDKSLYAFGVDLALNEDSGDLVLSPQGDLKVQYGVNNVRQTVANRLRTPQGQVPLHGDYGFPDNVGSWMYGADTVTQIQATLQDAIKKDPRITEVVVSNLTFATNGATMRIDVGVQGVQSLIPFSFSI